jgi:hypothetical protein
MILRKQLCISILLLIAHQTFSQSSQGAQNDSAFPHRFRVSTTWLSFANFGEEKTSTQHYELHFKYSLTSKDIVGLKFATWSLFQPMGILWWDGLLDKIDSESEFYPGRLRETGLGISYQRMLWKGLFATIEILPQLKTYVDENKTKIGNGFKLYTSYHIGYHIPLFKKQSVFIEPQIHFQNWMIDTNTPSEFKNLDAKWRNYFLFEPNLYIGIKF